MEIIELTYRKPKPKREYIGKEPMETESFVVKVGKEFIETESFVIKATKNFLKGWYEYEIKWK